MARSKADNKKPTSDRPEQIKKRPCLMCGENFTSHHYGERICPTCKGTAAWREGDIIAA
ncbi:MAG: hypothetical protein ACPGNT_07410 [Rhodospirillales bacterium]